MSGVPPPSPATPSSPSTLGFALSFLEGRGILVLRARTLFELATLERLELEIPGLRFPFDVTGGAAKFQHRRCKLYAAKVVLPERPAQQWLRARPALSALGLGDLTVQFQQGRVELGGRVQAGEQAVEVAAQLRVEPAGGRYAAMWLSDIALYGPFPLAAAQVGLALLVALGAPRTELTLEGAWGVVGDPIALLLWQLLPPHGWRLPDMAGARLASCEVSPGAIELSYAEGGNGTSSAIARQPEPSERFERSAFEGAEAHLVAGDPAAARTAYETLWRQGNGHAFVLRRLLDLGASATAWHAETEALAKEALASASEPAAAHLALARIAETHGRLQEAGDHYVALAALHQQAGDGVAVTRAQMAAARNYLASAPEQATSLLERASAARPQDLSLTELLLGRYEAERRHTDLAHYLRRLLAHEEAPPRRAWIYLRLGRLALDHLGQVEAALADLGRAIELEPADPDTWQALASAREQAGRSAEALEALEQAARLYAQRGQAAAEARTHLAAAKICEQRKEDEQALAHTLRAQALMPDDALAYARAAKLAERRGLFDEAARAYTKQAERTRGPARVEALVDLALLLWNRLGDATGAVAQLEAALGESEDGRALELFAQILARTGAPAQAAMLYARAQASLRAASPESTAERTAELALARGAVLEEAFELEEAAAAYEEATSSPPHAQKALRLLGALAQRRGDGAAHRTTLERLVEVTDDPEPLIELARLDCAAEDWVSARRRLERAIARPEPSAAALTLLCELLAKGSDASARLDALRRLAEARLLGGDEIGAGQALLERGALLLEVDRAPEAAADLAAATAAGRLDAHPEALTRLADAERLSGAFDAARKRYEQLLELQQGGQPLPIGAALLHRRLAECGEKLGEEAFALTHWRASLEQGAQGAEAQLCWKRIIEQLARQGEPAGALEGLAASAEDPATGEGSRERATRLYHAAEIARKRLGDLARAQALLERALALAPDFVAALDALEALAAETGSTAEIAALLGRKAIALARRPTEQCAVLGRLAQIHEQRGDFDRARTAYEQALAVDENFRPALLALGQQALAQGQSAAAQRHFGKLAVLEGASTAERSEAELGLGRLALAVGNHREAEHHIQAALELEPASSEGQGALADLFAAQERHAELAEILARRMEQETQPERLLELGLRRAALLQDTLGRPQEALTAYRELLALHPLHAGALQRLAELAQSCGAHADRALALERLVEIVELAPPSAEMTLPSAAALRVEIAELCLDHLGEAARGEAHLARALEHDPGCIPALERLERIARDAGERERADVLFTRRMGAERDEDRRAALVLDWARKHLEAGGDPAAVRPLLSRLGEEAPDAVLSLRAEVEERLGDGAAAGALWQALSARASDAGDPIEATYRVRLAEILAGPLRKPGEARQALDRALEIDPTCVAAAEAIVPLAERAGGPAQRLAALEGLRQVLRRTFTASEREREVLGEMARLYKGQGQIADSLERLRQAAQLTQDLDPWRELAKEAHAAGNLGVATQALEEIALRATEPLARGEALIELANALAESPADRAAARRALAQAVDLLPENEARLQAQRTLATWDAQAGDVETAKQLLETLGERAQKADWAGLAEAYERTGRAAEAVKIWQRAATGPAELAGLLAHAIEAETDEGRRRALEVRHGELVAHEAERTGDLEGAERALAKLLPHHPDARGLLGRLCELATRRGDEAAYLNHLEETLRRFPEDRAALRELATLRGTRGEKGEAQALLERLALLAEEPTARRDGLMQAADLLPGAHALDLLEQAAAMPEPRQALERLAQAAAQAGEPKRQIDALARLHPLLPAEERGDLSLRLAECLRSHGDRARARMVAWRACEELAERPAPRTAALAMIAELASAEGEQAEALEATLALAEAGALAPSQLEAAARLALACGEMERATELAGQAATYLAGGGQTKQATALLREASSTLAPVQPARAETLLRALCELDPADALGARALYGLCLSAGRPADAATALERALGAQIEPSERCELSLLCGLLYLEHLADPARGLTYLERATQAQPDPQRRDALERKVAEILLREHGEAERALGLIPKEGTPSDHALRGEALFALGRLEEADQSFQQALEDPDALTKHWAFAAGACAEAAGRLDQAAELLTRAAELAPTDPQPPRVLERVQRSRKDGDGITEALGKQIVLATDPKERARLWFRRAELYRSEDREAEAFRCLMEALASDRDLKEAMQAARPLAEKREAFDLAAELCCRLIPRAEADAERAELHADLGRLYAEHLGDVPGALRSYEQALRLRPRHPPWMRAVAPLRKRAGEPSRALPEQKPRLQEAELEALRAERDRLAAGVHEEPDVAKALVTLRRLLEIALSLHDDREADVRAQEILARAPDDEPAFAVRHQALLQMRDAEGLVELCRIRSAAISDPCERANLACEAAHALRELGDADGAVALLDEALARAPEHAGVLAARADVAFRSQDLPLAKELYTRLSEASPEAARAHAFRRGELAEMMGDGQTAEEELRDAVRLQPKHLAAHRTLARVYLTRGQYVQGLDELQSVADLLPASALGPLTEVHLQIGELATRFGRSAQARAALEQVLVHYPDHRPALELLAGVYAQLGLWQQAADTQGRLARLTEVPKTHAELLFRQGEIYRLQLHDLERAGDAYLRASDLDPTHVPTLWRLVEHFFRLREPSRLLEVLQDLSHAGASATDPRAPKALDAMAGLCYALTGHVKLARERLGAAEPEDVASHAAFLLRPRGSLGTEAMRAICKCVANIASLESGLESVLASEPGEAGAHRLLGFCRRRQKDPRAALHDAILAFTGDAEARVRATEQAAEAATELSRAQARVLHPRVEGAVRAALEALSSLGLDLGTWPPPTESPVPAPAELQALARELGKRMGAGDVELSLLDRPGIEPFPCPPRAIAVPTQALNLPEGELLFLLGRAFALLRSGGALLMGLDRTTPTERLAQLLRAQPEAEPNLPAAAGAPLAALRKSTSSAEAILFDLTLEASRAALVQTGDLCAALAALARLEVEAGPSRERPISLLHTDRLADLALFALRIEQEPPAVPAKSDKQPFPQ